MYCHNHNEKPATAVCVTCGTPICPDCTIVFEEKNTCPSCYYKKAQQNYYYWSAQQNTNLGIVFFEILLYAIGICLTFSSQILTAILGVLLMGLPHLIQFFRYNDGTLLTAIIETLFGIICTPIMIIKSFIASRKGKKEAEAWDAELKALKEKYPYLS